MDIMDEKADTELEEIDKPNKENSVSETQSEMLKGEEFIKLKQRGSIVTARKTSIFLSPSTPAMLGTATHSIRRKSLHLEKPQTSSERLESSMGTLLSKKEGSENIGVQSMQMEVPPVESFTPLEAIAITCVLEDCLEQLATIRFMIPADVDSRWDDSFKTIDETYGTADEPAIIFREDMGLLPIIPTTAEKMQRDRHYAHKVLETVLHDIKENNRFDSLQKEIDNIAKKQEDERNLEANAQIWLSQAEQLQELLKSDKQNYEDDRQRTTKFVQETDAQIDHAIFLNSGKLAYAEKWANARFEQQELKLTLQKTDMLNKLNDYTKEYNTEQIISAEINAYLEADIKEKDDQIVMWTKRYNEELIQRQQEIDELRKQIEEQKLELEEMQALRDKRQIFIDECIAEDERLQEEEKYREKLNNAAIIIQSVWRDYLTRNQLKKHYALQKQPKKHKKSNKIKKGKAR